MHAGLPPAEDLKLVMLADIARGGMGTVQLCRVEGGRLDGRCLAVKRLNPSIEQEPEFVNMFLDETWITARIASANVVRVEAWGRDAHGMFLAVELVQGVSLSRLIKESKEKQEPFAERTVANLISQVCSGLEGAHGLLGDNGAPLGLVHRDLTPGNILVGFDGVVKIADFGIAKAEERLTSTRIGMMKGKPAYMAPEQARGGGIDGRADLFALGVMMYELLSGQRPWMGKNDLEVLIAVSSTDPVDILQHRKVSQVFVDLTRRCLKKPPKDRYGSATEIKALLDAWRRERGFNDDDNASLSAFVRRNTAEQQKWFHEALGGALAQGGVTFADLEDKIDKGRKGVSGAQGGGPRPTSGVMRAAEVPAARPSASKNLEDIDDNARTQFMSGGGPSSLAPASPRLDASPGYAPRLASTIALSPEDADARLSAVRRSQGGGPAPVFGSGTIMAEPIPASQMPTSQAALSWGVPPSHAGGAQPIGATQLGPLSQHRVTNMPVQPMSPSQQSFGAGPMSGPMSGPVSSSPLGPTMSENSMASASRPLPGRMVATMTDDSARASGGTRWWLYALVLVIFCAAGGGLAWIVTHGLPTSLR